MHCWTNERTNERRCFSFSKLYALRCICDRPTNQLEHKSRWCTYCTVQDDGGQRNDDDEMREKTQKMKRKEGRKREFNALLTVNGTRRDWGSWRLVEATAVAILLFVHVETTTTVGANTRTHTCVSDRTRYEWKLVFKAKQQQQKKKKKNGTGRGPFPRSLTHRKL